MSAFIFRIYDETERSKFVEDPIFGAIPHEAAPP